MNGLIIKCFGCKSNVFMGGKISVANKVTERERARERERERKREREL